MRWISSSSRTPAPKRELRGSTAAVAEFESRAHRDEVMDKVMKDPRVTEMVEGDQIADMSQMRYGGFQTFVNP